MKKLAHLLLVLTLIGFSACGSKKNKTDENASTTNQFCDAYGNCYNNNYNTNPYGSPTNLFVNKEQLVTALQNGNAFVTSNNTEYQYFDEYDFDEDGFLGFIDTYKFVGTTAVVTNPNGSIQGAHPYGTSFSDIISKLVTDVSGASNFYSYNNGIYFIETNGKKLYINTRRSIGANPVQIDYSNGQSFKNRNP